MSDRKSSEDEYDLYEPIEEPRPEVGRTGYDTLVSFGRWLRGVARKILLLIIIGAAWWFLGWFAAASLIAGAVIWYVLLDRWLNDQGAVYVDDVHDGVWTTWSVGQDAWAEYRIKGVPFAFRSSDGRPRYMAEAFDPDNGVIRFSWIHQLSSWKFFMTFRAHRNLLEILEKVLPENLKLRLYPRILGYREAAAAMQPVGSIMDQQMLDANVDSDLWVKERESIDRFFNLGLDEILEQTDAPVEKVKGGEE